MSPDLTIITAIICAILGPGVMAVFVQWLLSKRDRKQSMELEKTLESSPNIKRLELEIYRQTLFLPTHSRMQHENQLDAGREYMRLGGNGPGHIRCQQLADEYKQRLETDDWDYSSA